MFSPLHLICNIYPVVNINKQHIFHSNFCEASWSMVKREKKKKKEPMYSHNYLGHIVYLNLLTYLIK